LINSRFAVAVHLLTLLTAGRRRFPGCPLTSESAAESVNTNPVVVRRILGSLRKVGMVSSQPGPSGGWFLERQPEQINLRDVYRAVKEDTLFSMHHRQPSSGCMIGANIQDVLQGFFADAEAAMEAELSEKTIADVVQAVMTRVEQCALEQGA
jgi:Rrf2 family protein